MITKRKAVKIINKWRDAYSKWILAELEVWDFEDERKQVLEWLRGIKLVR